MKFEIREITEFQGYVKRKFSRTMGPSRSRPPANDTHLEKTLGMVLSCHTPSELFTSKAATGQDNAYVWFSYADSIEYLVYEDELEKFDFEKNEKINGKI